MSKRVRERKRDKKGRQGAGRMQKTERVARKCNSQRDNEEEESEEEGI